MFWPGVAAGVGAPTDRPDRIAERFVELGARVVHVVDFDGARAGRPANLEAVGAIASRVAVPIQLAGGLEGADQIRLAFAAGATRVVLAMSVVDDPRLLADVPRVAGDWLAVGLDPRPERLAAFPWRRAVAAGVVEALVDELVGAASDGSCCPTAAPSRTTRVAAPASSGRPTPTSSSPAGFDDVDGVRRLRDGGVAGIILGEALLSGAIDFPQPWRQPHDPTLPLARRLRAAASARRWPSPLVAGCSHSPGAATPSRSPVVGVAPGRMSRRRPRSGGGAPTARRPRRSRCRPARRTS